MASVNWERVARGAGVGFVVALIAAFIVMGEQPKVGDSAQQIVSFYDGDRGRVLTGLVIFAIAFVLLLWFVGAVANALREAGEGRLAATTIAFAAVFVGIQAVSGATIGALSLNVAATGDEGVVRALNTLAWSTDVIAAFPLAGVIAAASVGLMRSGILPGWYGLVGIAAAILAVLHGTNWSTDGFWSPSGGYLWVTIIAALAWALITSILLYAAAPTAERAPGRAPATPMP
jgi:hypothetical protein